MTNSWICVVVVLLYCWRCFFLKPKERKIFLLAADKSWHVLHIAHSYMLQFSFSEGFLKQVGIKHLWYFSSRVQIYFDEERTSLGGCWIVEATSRQLALSLYHFVSTFVFDIKIISAFSNRQDEVNEVFNLLLQPPIRFEAEVTQTEKLSRSSTPTIACLIRIRTDRWTWQKE